jgi:DNA-binding CsgD family transcriptional regulator
VSEAAVKFHLGNLFRKLAVQSRVRLLEAARLRAIIP